MGRLMDSIMAAVGMKPSDRVVLSHDPIDTDRIKDNPAPSTQTDTNNSKLAQLSQSQNAQTKQDAVAEVKQAETVDEEDCLSCRVIGGGVCFVMAGTLARITQQVSAKVQQQHRTFVILNGGAMVFCK